MLENKLILWQRKDVVVKVILENLKSKNLNPDICRGFLFTNKRKKSIFYTNIDYI